MNRMSSAFLFLTAGIFSASGVALEYLGAAAAQNAPRVSWRVRPTNLTAGLRGVCVVDSRVAWASGTQGTFLKTLDGGKTWLTGKIPGAEKMDFRDIEAFSTTDALVLSIGRPAKIFKTKDGGKTWAEKYSNDAEGIFLDAMAFFDERSGLAVGDPMDGRIMLITSDDGGETWQELPLGQRPEATEGEGAFAASGTCLTVYGKHHAWICTGGPEARVLASSDRGRTWDAVVSPLNAGKASAGGFSLVFRSDKEGLMVGGDYKDEAAVFKNAAITADGGKTWAVIETQQPSGFRECVIQVPGTSPPLFIAVGPNGSDYSLDLGKSWTPILGPTGFHSAAVSKADGSGWAVGRDGLIARMEIKGR